MERRVIDSRIIWLKRMGIISQLARHMLENIKVLAGADPRNNRKKEGEKMDWRKVRRGETKRMPGLMNYTATVYRARKITVEAETSERATTMFKRRLEKGEIILSVQTILI